VGAGYERLRHGGRTLSRLLGTRASDILWGNSGLTRALGRNEAGMGGRRHEVLPLLSVVSCRISPLCGVYGSSIAFGTPEEGLLQSVS